MTTQVTHPTKEAVRELMGRHLKERQPLDMEQVKRELGWHLVEADRKAVERRSVQRAR